MLFVLGTNKFLEARCVQSPADTFKASIVLDSTLIGAGCTVAVDSTAPGGVNNVTNLAEGSEANLISVGPTTFPTWQTGQYATTGVENGSVVSGFSGTVSAATRIAGGPDCQFQATGFAAAKNIAE